MSRTKRIGIIMGMTSGYLLEVFHGITSTANSNSHWNVRVAGLFDLCVPHLLDWRPHGILTCVISKELKQYQKQSGIPVVGFTGSFYDNPFPTVHTDDFMVGKMAAEHFLEMNLENFAYWSGHDSPFTVVRKEGFCITLVENGVSNEAIHADLDCSNALWRKRDRMLAKWLKKLPKPVGLFVSQDAQAYYITKMARELGIDIPNDIALLGVDNDSVICELTDPPLSSIALAARQVGINATAMLEMLLDNRKLPALKVYLPPLGIVGRGSTDMLAIEDNRTVEAVRFIRQNATRGIKVSDVLKKVAISRRDLERRFRKIFNRSPGQEIHRVQINKIRHLLLDGNKTITEIASLSGFCDAEYMSRVFKRDTGVSPMSYRKKHKKI